MLHTRLFAALVVRNAGRVGPSGLALLLAMSILALGAVPASFAQQPDRSLQDELKERTPEKLDHLRSGDARPVQGAPRQRATAAFGSKAIGGFDEITQSQSWVLNENPNPRLNFNLTGTPQYAGDVTGDGTNDYLYSTSRARDERSSALEDRTGKTALFFGGTPPQTEDQLVYTALEPAGDLNNDGHADALSGIGTGTVRFYTGGSGGYTDSGNTLSRSLSGSQVAGFADLDGDGNEDVVLHAPNNPSFEVVYGAGTLSNATSTVYTPSSNYSNYTIRTADLDGDGQGELVRLAGEAPNMEVQVFSVDASRTLTQEQKFVNGNLQSNASSNQIALVDVNGDGPLELVTTSGDDVPSLVFAGQSGGSFSETAIEFQQNDALPAGDLDQDGNHDFFVYDAASDTRYVAFGPDNLSDGLSLDTEISYSADVSGRMGFLPSGGLGDVTSDGRPDIVLNYTRDQGEVGRRFFSVNTDGSARSPTDVTYPREHFFDRINEVNEIGDFNGNGATDFAVVRDNLNRVEIFYGGGSISSTPDLTITPPSTVSHVSSGDVNGDNNSDLLVGGKGSGRIDIYFGGSNADATADHSILASDVGFPIHIPRVVGDINNDGYADWVASDRGFNGDFSVSGQNVAIFFGDGSSLPSTADATLQYPDGRFLGEVKAGVGDVNGDGIDDFAFDNTVDGQMDVYFGNTSGSFSTPADLSLPVRPYAGLAGGDFNGDGTSDIAAVDYSTPGNALIDIFYGGSDIDTTPDLQLPIPAGVGGGDTDGDGIANNTIGVLESPGDVDGNGADELIHGSSFFGFQRHALLYRPSTDRDPIRVFRGPNSNAALGSQQFIYSAAMGDFTDNGTTDFVATQFNDDNDAFRSSRVYRYAIDVPSQAPRIAAPSELTASAGGSSIDLSWSAVEDQQLAKYYVYRTLDPIGASTRPSDLTPYDSTSAGTTAFTDTDVPGVSGYYYRVTAVDSDGNESFFSPEDQATAVQISQSDLAVAADYEDGQRDTSAAGGTTIRPDSVDVSDVSNGVAALEVNASGSGSVTINRKANLPRSDRLSFLVQPDPSTDFTLTLTFVENASGTEASYDVQIPVNAGEAWVRHEVSFSDVGASFNPVASRSGGNGSFLRLEISANKDVTYHVDEFEFGTQERALVKLEDFERTTLAYGPEFCNPTFGTSSMVESESDGFTARTVQGSGCFGYNYFGDTVSDSRLSADLQSDDVLSFRANASTEDSLYVFLETADNEFERRGGAKIPLPVDRWGRVQIPLQALGGTVSSLKEPGLYNVGFETRGNTPDFKIDDVKLMGRAGPGAPSALAGTVRPDTIDLSWSAPTSGTADRYFIYRNTSAFDVTPGPGVYVPIDTVDGSTTSFQDTTVVPGTTYNYRVAAIDADGNQSRFSNGIRKLAEGLAASATTTVSGDGTESFNETGTDLNFSGVNSSGDVTVNRYIGEPSDAGNITEDNVSNYRLTIDAASSLEFNSAQIRLAVSVFGGIENPSNVTIYTRDTPGSGSFTSIETTVGDNGTPDNVSDDTLYASTETFSEFALASNTDPLPVELASFDAETDGEEVHLRWTTASETDNAEFRVQRHSGDHAGDGTPSWTTVGTLDGAGTTTEQQSYRYTDAGLPYEADQLTYRLVQVDTDGATHYTDEVTVQRRIAEVQLLGTFPNPVRQQATVRYAVPDREQGRSGSRRVTMRLYDVLGRQVQTVVDAERTGRHEHRIDVSRLPSGVYFLRLTADGKTRTQKLTVVQ